MSLSRRQVLRAITAACASAAIDPGALSARLAADQPCAASSDPGTLVETLTLFRSGGQVQPFGVKLGGRGLDARLVTDLSTLDSARLTTPTTRAFIRTEAPRAAHPGSVGLHGSGTDQSSPTIADLRGRARSMGAHLLECSGNNNPANFGLMSVCEWHGVPLTDLVNQVRTREGGYGVLVSGMDPAGESTDSTAGASWIFPIASLEQLGAFLAVRMNREALPDDHGAPIRLVVPGWYGCTWIKWVTDIRIVGPNEPATGQMKEFAGRTHQAARHDLARDYTPADIQSAAMPIRVEKRRARGGLHYRVVGIVWGGTKPVERLAIRFRASEDWKIFPVCPPPTTHRRWSLWDYTWKPAVSGIYDIALRVPDPSVPQRRLDTGYYIRQVHVEEI